MSAHLAEILEALFRESGLTPSEVMAKVERMSDAYTRDGAMDVGDGRAALAYTLYFLPEHFLKPHLVLAELKARGLMPAGRRCAVVDAGAGPGTAVWALRELLPDADIDATLIDRSPHLLEAAGKIAAGYGAPGAVKRVRADLTAMAAFTGADLLLFCNTLSELADDQAACAVVSKAMAALRDGGAVVVIEPASDRGVATATAVRRTFAESAVLPCPAPGACPSIERHGRLCQFDIAAPVPRALQRVVTAHHQRQKFCAIALSKRPAAHAAGTFRVIEPFKKLKWGFEATVCDGRYLGPLLLHSKKHEDRRAAGAIGAGDLLHVVAPPPEPGKPVRIDGASKMEIVHPFVPPAGGRP